MRKGIWTQKDYQRGTSKTELDANTSLGQMLPSVYAKNDKHEQREVQMKSTAATIAHESGKPERRIRSTKDAIRALVLPACIPSANEPRFMLLHRWPRDDVLGYQG